MSYKFLLFNFCIGFGFLSIFSCGSEPQIKGPTPAVDFKILPRWRGFNLLEKFTADSNQPYKEEDFKLIAELGFNFVRLPLDYRCFVHNNNFKVLHEKTMLEIDQAVKYGIKYKIHVCINFHRAPGYCVNPPKEKTSLWEDGKTQENFCSIWSIFAARYKGIPNQTLSFNLINEPDEIESTTYARVMMKAIEAIREIDPHRFIIIDGLKWGTIPVNELMDVNTIQSTRGYAPFELTHYQAEWVAFPHNLPLPTWPVDDNFSAYLYGPIKSEFKSPLNIYVNIEKDTEIFIKIHKVSYLSRLLIKADDKIIFDKRFEPGPGEGEWSSVVHEEKWNIYQNIYDKYYQALIPAETKQVTIENTEGDWLLFTEIRLKPYNNLIKEEIVIFPNSFSWGEKQGTIRLTMEGTVIIDKKNILYDKNWFRNVYLAPWINIKKQGCPVIIGEFGVYRHTPHNVTLAWMEDFLTIATDYGFGWALWNFRGSFGVLDSERADVQYVDFYGHKLDQKMLDILLRY